MLSFVCNKLKVSLHLDADDTRMYTQAPPLNFVTVKKLRWLENDRFNILLDGKLFCFHTRIHLHFVILGYFRYLHKRNTSLLWPGTPRFLQCPQSRWDGGTGWLPGYSGGRGGRRPWRSPSEFSVEILCERLLMRALFATLCDQDVPASQ